MYDVWIYQYYHYNGKYAELSPFLSDELSRFITLEKAKRFLCYAMAVFPPRCKDKKNLANDIQCELYFLQNYFFFLNFSHFGTVFLSFTPYLFIRTPFYWQTSTLWSLPCNTFPSALHSWHRHHKVCCQCRTYGRCSQSARH